MTHIVILTTWAAQRPAPDATEHMHFFDHDGFVALDSTSSRPEGPNAPRQLAAMGWDALGDSQRKRQFVKIQLPDGVTAGPYKVGGVTLYGLHTETQANNGMGGAVFAEIGTPASIREAGSDEAAFAAAVASRVILTIPANAAEGRPVRIAAPVVAVSPIYTATIPAGWAEELGEQIDRETGRKTK